MTTPLQKAAQGAAEEFKRDWLYEAEHHRALALETIILRHLATVQTELDEARVYIEGYIDAITVVLEVIDPNDEKAKIFISLIAKAQSWLARNPVKKG